MSTLRIKKVCFNVKICVMTVMEQDKRGSFVQTKRERIWWYALLLVRPCRAHKKKSRPRRNDPFLVRGCGLPCDTSSQLMSQPGMKPINSMVIIAWLFEKCYNNFAVHLSAEGRVSDEQPKPVAWLPAFIDCWIGSQLFIHRADEVVQQSVNTSGKGQP